MINDYEATRPIAETGTKTTLSNDAVISTLNGLIETCKDGMEGFKTAAEGVVRSDLKTLFGEFSQERARFFGELQSLVSELGGDPEASGSFAGAVHRGWMDLKATLTGKDDAAILNECERGEDSAKNAYKEALQTALPSNVVEVLQNQYASIQSTHDRVKALRDAANADKSSTASTGR
ncbi:MAG TPA: PA2169 family four-helix-bundle protein [Pyrinomonadaceae bacterium]|nr:PA2169 family four-helix-bundle protein [Pyrinomonadaceae bacterium]